MILILTFAVCSSVFVSADALVSHWIIRAHPVISARV